MDVDRIDHVNIRIPKKRVDEALAFYRDFLGLEPLKLDRYRAGDRTSFGVKISGQAMINIRPKENFESPDGMNYDHFCLVVDTDVETLRERCEEHGVEVIRQGTPWSPAGRAPALYV
ncbi:MAG: VOC family protein, partial [Candidatus Nanohaloarchaea archaeon]|nr:VOC family protein [Candidatus Nanohaloarchaea archaeon]